MPDSTVVRGTRKTGGPRGVTAGFFSGGGEMGRRMRAADWSRTPLGAIDRWPVSLRTAVRIVLTARQPMILFWGERFVTLYNDAAKPMVSTRHPQLLGQPAASAWHELWEALGSRVEQVRAANAGAYDESVRLPVPTALEDHSRFAVSLSPVPNDEGKAGGVLCLLNEAASMHEAVVGLSSELDLETLVQKVTDAGTRLAKARFGAFFYNVDDENGGSYRLFALSGAPREKFDRFGMPRATPLFAPTFRGEGVIRVDDIAKDPRYGRAAPHNGMPQGHLPVRSYLAVPVVSRNGKVLGGLFFGHPEPGMFDERAERNVRAIAAHAAVAMDNANLFAIARSEIEERTRVQAELAATRDELALQLRALTSLHELAAKLAAIDDLDAALQAILETAVEVQNADFGSINLHDPENGVLVLRAHVGFREEVLPMVEALPPGPATGACGAAFHRGERVVVLDVETDPCFVPLRDFAHKLGFRSVHSTPISTRGGALLGVLSVHFRDRREPTMRDQQIADVCARHAADAIRLHRGREALRESERLYRAIGESINYGVWVCDENGQNVYTSESFLKLTGLTQGNYAKSIWSLLLHPDDVERVRKQWRETVASGRDWETEVQVKTVDGDYRAILSRGVAIRDEAGRITGWAGMNLDVDRLKKVEHELRELDQRKNEFLATLAHELRNPLAPIRNGLEIMRLGRGNAGMVEQARTMMERQLHQMIRLVDDLLDVSRVSRGKIELRKERIALQSALNNAIETAKPLLDQNGQELVLHIPSEPVLVDGDLTRLSQVFANLLNNAAKYTDKGGRIAVSLAAVLPGHVEVRIEDNGIGIPEAMIDRIFDIFTQVDRSLEKARGGLGIGLSIARRLVEMHGGTITASSAGHGMGSEFTVKLPRVERNSAAEPGERGASARTEGGQRRRVLIADDNFDSASSLCLVLQVMGHDVRVANDGLEALALAQTFAPEAIFLDIGMPRLNGYEACRKLRESPATA
jgi:PAS domain S-box-containing protein